MDIDRKKCFIQNCDGNSIAEIVSVRTGMSDDCLLNDCSVYRVSYMQDAVDLFWEHYEKDSNIYVFTDYDADGICSAAIMDLLAHVLGIVNISIKVPRRFTDGYGVKPANVEDMHGGLLLTVDNGVKAVEAVDVAKEHGVDVIILDHHVAGKDRAGCQVLPHADVLVDPHVTGGDYEHYCGAGLAYKFCQTVLRTKPHSLSKNMVNYVLASASSFAAVATVADAVPLTYDNRNIVKQGLYCMQKGFCTTGLKLLLEAFDLDRYITASDLGFRIGPAINAYGRLEDYGARLTEATIAYAGGISNDAKVRASVLKEKNNERKGEARVCYERAVEIVRQSGQEENSFIVVYDECCKAGIAGIVAGRLTETYHVPSIVLVPTSDENLIKGSGRSPEGINLERILAESMDYIFAYGGHPGACGLTIYKDQLDAFREQVCAVAPEKPAADGPELLYYDMCITEAEVPKILDELDKYGPFGQGNPEIIFLIENIVITPGVKGYVEHMGDVSQHVKLRSKDMEITWFDGSGAYQSLGEPHRFSAIGTLSRHVWNGISMPQFQIIDILPDSVEKTDAEPSFAERLGSLVRVS